MMSRSLDREDLLSRAAAALFGVAIRVHDSTWNSRIRRPWVAPVPVISIGNLAAGGTGKTPAVIQLAGELRARGRRPAILTRGHGRRSGERVILTPGEVAPSPDMAGDEPLEMFNALRVVPVVVSADRRGSAILAVDRFGADLLILDDGFQHRPMARTVDIVLVDGTRPLGNGRLLPAGPLREPASALRRADMILLTRADEAPDIEASRNEIRRLGPQAWIGTAIHRVTGLRSIIDEGSSHRPPDGPVCAVTGIARPSMFEASIRAMGLDVGSHLAFSDHHRFDTRDLARVISEAAGAAIVTTAKDAVRWRAVPGFTGAGWWVLSIQFEPDTGFVDEVMRRLGGHG